MSAVCYKNRRESRYALLLLLLGQKSQRNVYAVNIKKQMRERMRDKLIN